MPRLQTTEPHLDPSRSCRACTSLSVECHHGLLRCLDFCSFVGRFPPVLQFSVLNLHVSPGGDLTPRGVKKPVILKSEAGSELSS